MRKAIGLKCALVIIALICIGIFAEDELSKINHEAKATESVYFADEINGKQLRYEMWYVNDMQSYYLVLPSMYKNREINFLIYYNDRKYDLYIDNKKYDSEEVWNGIKGEEIYQIEIRDVLGRIRMKKPLQVLVSSDVPVMMISVDSDEALLYAQDSQKRYVQHGEMVLFDAEGRIETDTKLKKIAVRGNDTSLYPKKPFRIEFAEEIPLLGMEPATKWNLLAEAREGTYIRNKIMLDWAKEVTDGYSVDSEHVELFVNGQYQGLYLLTETTTVGSNRLELDLDNSVFAEMDLYYRAEENDFYFATDRQHYWVIHSEEYLGSKKLNKIQEYFNEIEDVLYGESVKSLEEMIDFDSWTDAWLMEEISGDVDLGTTSQFAYIENWEQRSLLKAGPAWDFDYSLGNANLEVFRNPRNLVAAIPNTKGIECVTQNRWLAQMYKNETFKEMLVEKFKNEVSPKVKRLLEYQIDDYVNGIHRATVLDSLRWRSGGKIGYNYEDERFKVVPTGDYHRYDIVGAHVEYLKEFLREKEKFLTELWVEEAEFEVIIEERNGPGMNLELNNDIYTWIRKDNMEE